MLYHLKERTIEHFVVPHCEEHGVGVVAYSPLGSGDFPASPVLDEVAAGRGATPRQVALAFLTRRDSVVAIPKAASVAHALENAAAGDVVLADEEVARIEEAFPRGRPRHGVPVI